MFVEISKPLKKKVQIAMNGAQSCVFDPVCTFYNGNTGYRKQWKTLDKLIVAQDFTESFSDIIQGTLQIQPDELRILIQHLQDLHCSIILKPIKTRSFIYGKYSEPIIITGRVLVDFKDDLDKIFTAQSFGQRRGSKTTKTPDQQALHLVVDFHIVEEDVYTLRNTQMNCIVRDSDPEQIIHWAAERMGAESVSVIPPDNKQKYSNFVIPPMKSVKDIFPYMQDRCGIYSKGLGYYYTGKKMYVYPKADQNQTTSPTEWVVHIINVPKDHFGGANTYHNVRTEEKQIYIASITETEATTKVTEATENYGNTHVSLHADRIQDNLWTKNTDGTVNRNKETVSAVSLQNTQANMTSGTQRVVYDGESSNPYAVTSSMASMNATQLQTGWIHAIPRLLEPGETIFYHFDGQNGEYKIQKGRLERVVYISELQTANMGRQRWMSFNASMEIRLDPEFLSESETQILES